MISPKLMSVKWFEALLVYSLSQFQLSGQLPQPNIVQLAEKGDLAGIESILARGANPNAVDDSNIGGWTALMAAARNGNLPIARALICTHADLNLSNQYGATALDIAILAGYEQVASFISIAGGKGRTKLPPPLQPEAPTGRTASEAITFIKSAIQEPRIKARIPMIELLSEKTEVRQEYGAPVGKGETMTLTGEVVDIRLVQGGKTIASASWRTQFPFSFPKVQIGSSGFLLSAEVHTEDLIAKLLDASVFTLDDLAELARSSILEIRLAATGKLTDQLLLAKIATEDPDPRVREAATGKLTDQVMLARLATQDKNRRVREAALKNLTDDIVWVHVLGCHP